MSVPAGVRQLTRSLGATVPATVVSAVCGSLLVLLAGRALGPARFTVFSGFWAALFIVGGLLGALEQETSRLVAAARLTGASGRAAVARMLLVGGGTAAAAALMLLAGGSFLVGHLFGGDVRLLLLTIAGAAGFAAQVVVRGALVGAGRVGGYAALVAAEPLLRTALMLPALAHPSTFGLAAATTAGSFAWLPFLPLLRSAVGDGPAGERPAAAATWRRCGQLVAAGGCSAALIAGYPALVAALHPHAPAASVGVVLATLTVSRAPLLALAPVQALLVPLLVRSGGVGAWLRRRGAPLAAGSLVLLVAVGGIAAVLGPAVVRLAYGSAYRVGAGTVAALTDSAVLMVGLMIATAALVAADRHRMVTTAWVAAVLAAAAVLVAGPATVAVCVPVSLLLAAAAGVAVAVAALLRRPR